MQYMPVFSPLQPLPSQVPVKRSHYRVTSGHLMSRDVISCRVTASSSELQPLGNEMYSIRQFSALYSHFQVTSGQMTSLPVTSGHLRSGDVISCHVTASSCELQP